MADLFDKYADALSRPRGAYRDLEAAFGAVDSAAKGYEQGQEIKDKKRQREFGRKTLSEVLGRQVAGPVGAVPISDLKTIDPALDYLGKVEGRRSGDSQDRIDARQLRSQQAQDRRQTERFGFLREMVGAKGNKDAVNQAKNAVQGLGYVDDLYKAMDTLSGLQKSAAGTPVLDKFFPTINALKQNVLRTAGFAEGGKNLTETEREIVVDSFLPTTLDDPESRKLKRQIAQDYYTGTIDLYDAARLLGPAGEKIQAIAEAQRQRSAQSGNNALLRSEVGGGDLDAIFSEEGVQ